MTDAVKELYSAQPTTTASLILTNSATRRKVVMNATAHNVTGTTQSLTFWLTGNGEVAADGNRILFEFQIRPYATETVFDIINQAVEPSRGLRCAASSGASVNLFISGFEEDLA
jgi:hypothetical protein